MIPHAQSSPRAGRTRADAAWCRCIECPIEVDTASYFVSTIELRRGEASTMQRKRLFLATSAIAADAAEYFSLPRDRTLIVGSHVEV